MSERDAASIRAELAFLESELRHFDIRRNKQRVRNARNGVVYTDPRLSQSLTHEREELAAKIAALRAQLEPDFSRTLVTPFDRSARPPLLRSREHEHDRIPLDRVAARVTSKGFDYQSAKRVQTADSPTPLPTRTFDGTKEHDLTGRRFGRFVVTGYAEHPKRRWVVRCACGTYSIRTTAAVKNPENAAVDRCEACRQLAFLQRRDTQVRNDGTKWLRRIRRQEQVTE